MKITIEHEGRDPVEILEDVIWDVQHSINVDENSCCTIHEHYEYKGIKICPASKNDVDLLFELKALQESFKNSQEGVGEEKKWDKLEPIQTERKIELFQELDVTSAVKQFIELVSEIKGKELFPCEIQAKVMFIRGGCPHS